MQGVVSDIDNYSSFPNRFAAFYNSHTGRSTAVPFDAYQSRVFHQKEVSPDRPSSHVKGIHDLVRYENSSGIGETGKIVEDDPDMERLIGYPGNARKPI
jgi:hypothetical protein